MTSVERFLEDSNYRSKFPEDLNPERTEWGDLYSWLSTAEYAVFDLLDENKKLKAQIGELKKGKQYETCPYRSTDMGCDYCDYRDRNLKDEWGKK